MQTEDSKPAILWAIDPFQTDIKPDSASVARLKAWAAVSGWDLKPVYVLSEASQGFGEMSKSEKSEWLRQAAVRLQNYLTSLGISNARTPEILPVESRHQRDLAKALATVAAQTGAPWIVVSSHGHQGLNRFMFGSFADALVRYATCPVLFMSHRASAIENVTIAPIKILVPTDFSPESREAFHKILALMKGLKAEILLFYANAWPTMGSGFDVPVVITPDLLEEQEVMAREAAEGWIKEAQAQGFGAQLVCDGCVSPYEVGSAILKTAKDTHATFISLSCAKGHLSAFLNGSVSRDVFRQAESPVMVFGPQTITGAATN